MRSRGCKGGHTDCTQVVRSCLRGVQHRRGWFNPRADMRVIAPPLESEVIYRRTTRVTRGRRTNYPRLETCDLLFVEINSRREACTGAARLASTDGSTSIGVVGAF